MNYETIAVHQTEHVCSIALHRPDKLNAFTPMMHRELKVALQSAATDPSVRCLLITGEGRAFSAGQDLAALQTGEPVDYEGLLRDGYNPIIRLITEMDKPVVAAVNGVAAGAGCSLALACDVRLGSTNARFVQAFQQVGLVPDSGATWLLPRIVGFSKAVELAMFGEMVNADEALALGLVQRLVEPAQLMEEAMRVAIKLASGPTQAYAMMKRAFYRGMTSSLVEALDYEATLQAQAGATKDHAEGVAAFLEKRPPRFEGR